MHYRKETLIEFDVEIDAPPEDVFVVVRDPRSKLLWVPAIQNVRLDDQVITTGTTYMASSGVGPFEFEVSERIDTLDEPNRVVYEGQSWLGRFQTTWTITPAESGSRARYRMENWFPATTVSRIFRPLIAAIIRPLLSRKTSQRVKTFVENSLWPTERR